MESGKRKKSARGGGLAATAKANKKTKKQKPKSPSSDLLLDDTLLSLVGEFLDAHDLLNFATCCKDFMDPKYLNYNVVVRSASFTGGHPKTKLDNIISCIRKRSIWTPSPLRLLRFVNGRRCEKCMMERRKKVGNTNVLQYNFGVYYCLECASPTHTRGCSKKVSKNKKWMPFLSHQRVAIGTESSGGSTTLFKSPAVDISGKPIGPLITVQEIEKTQKTKGSIDKFLETIDQNDPYAKHSDKIIEIYDKFVDDAAQREDEKKQQAEKKRDVKMNAISKKSAKIVDALSDLVGDVLWKEDLFQFTMEPVSWRAKTLRATFQCRIVDEILEPIMKAPASKGTTANLQAAAKELCSIFRSVSLKPLLQLEFLSTLKEDDPFKRLFLERYQNSPAWHWLLGLEREDVKLLEEGRVFQVFLMHEDIFFMRGLESDVYDTLESAVDIPPGNIVRRINDDDDDEEGVEEDREYHGMTEDLRRSLAKSMWKEIQDEYYSYPDDTTLLDLSEHYHRCLEEFPTIYRAAMDFLAHPKHRISRRREQRFLRWKHGVADNIAALRARDFQKISKYIEAETAEYRDSVLRNEAINAWVRGHRS